LGDIGKEVVETTFDHDRTRETTRFLGLDERVKVRVIPIQARGMIKRNLVPVGGLRKGFDVDKYVVAVADRAHVQPVNVQVRWQRKPVEEMQRETIAGADDERGAGELALILHTRVAVGADLDACRRHMQRRVEHAAVAETHLRLGEAVLDHRRKVGRTTGRHR
jgi:hypothetical protein